jgi:trehalose/maltose hydrolase-like predicted phosphorylase
VSGIISPEPVTEWHPRYLPPYLSNGVVGLRLGTHPLAIGTATLSGLEGIHPTDEVPTFAQAPYPLALDIMINHASMAGMPQQCNQHEQRYDFSCGEVETRFTVTSEGVCAEVRRLVFCSRTHPTLVLMDTTVRVNRDCEFGVEALIDTNIIGRLLSRQTELPGSSGRMQVDGCLHWGVLGELSTCGVAYVTEFAGTPEVTRRIGQGRACPLSTVYSFHAEPGREYRLRRIVSFVPGEMHRHPHLQAVRLVEAGQLRGFDQLRQDNREEWGRLWEGRIVLAGASSRWQRIADAAYFYLHTSAHQSSPSSTSIFGLAYWPNYHYYRGHIMWDVDTFALPPLMLTNPDTVRGLLSFRYSRIPAARANAAMAGYEGLQYPWEASPDRGQESAPVRAMSPAVEHHVSMDAALAFARFVHATGDREFGIDYAWPVISGVAKWVACRMEQTARGWEFRRVNGPAETGITVDNNAFVNMAAILTLREAAIFGRFYNRGTPELWEAMASRIVLPFDSQRGIILNHDGYHPDEDKGETPEALAGFCPLGYMADPEVERRTLDYYLQLADKYAGAPMLSSQLGVYAAWTGDRGAALELFERGYADFIVEPFTITTEYSPAVYPHKPIAGPFSANIGGFLIACLYGLPGIYPRIGTAASWCRRPVVLPRGWDAIHVEQVWARGEPVRLVAEHGAHRAWLRG